jgi:hypothetical protein
MLLIFLSKNRGGHLRFLIGGKTGVLLLMANLKNNFIILKAENIKQRLLFLKPDLETV